jgi:hypothetical protein
MVVFNVRLWRFSSKAALLLLALNASGQTDVRDSPRLISTPNAKVKSAINLFKAQDPQASFTFFAGHTDSFATRAKAQVPDYAIATLKQLGLSTVPRIPRRLAAPVWAQTPRPGQDLDANLDVALPFVKETAAGTNSGAQAQSDAPDDGRTGVKTETRTQPPKNPHEMVAWDRPDDRTVALERRAATLILQSFLARFEDVFGVFPEELTRTVRLVDYQPGAYFRKATYEQYYSAEEKLLYGRTLVHFDLNWNVIGISRMIITPAKYTLAAPAKLIGGEYAARIAAGVSPDKSCGGMPASVRRIERAVDMIRGLRVWDVEMIADNGACHWRTIVDAGSGKVVNVNDLVDRAYTDAKVNRWYFPSGNQFTPQQIVSTGIYTRNDRRLEHDFFYLMNDHRCEGSPETSCSETGFPCTWCSSAHGTTSGSSYIRATRKSNRDFSNYFPWGSSEAFAETNTYYWARSFAQWLKPSLDALGVLPSSAANYPRVLMITDACRSGSVHNSSYSVTTDDNKGEGTNVIRLAHRDPAGASNHNAACESGGCFDNPSNIHHEMNHFFMKRYYGVGSDLDCGAANQLKFTHEGILGTAVPQAFWHNYYGVGYSPSSTNKLYFSNSNIGRVHTSDSNRMTVGNYLCVNYTGDPYRAGRVAGQALWEFYHGVKVTGSSTTGTWYPSTDTDFNVLVYWAADLQAASTYKDRYEFANRVMEILDKHSNWSSQGKQDYCEVFQHHELRNFIQAEYCN